LPIVPPCHNSAVSYGFIVICSFSLLDIRKGVQSVKILLLVQKSLKSCLTTCEQCKPGVVQLIKLCTYFVVDVTDAYAVWGTVTSFTCSGHWNSGHTNRGKF